jgi:TPR repeat protein
LVAQALGQQGRQGHQGHQGHEENRRDESFPRPCCPCCPASAERSGERGNAWAIRDLGRFYEEGARGLTRDLNKATDWKRKALAFDDQEARGWLIAHHLLE